MSCRKIVFVVCMLILVLDATPWRPRKQGKARVSQAVTTRRFVKSYIRVLIAGNDIPSEKPDVVLLATITPIDEYPLHRYKEPILHKAHRRADNDLRVKPLEIEGAVISGINDWFILDDFNEFDPDELYELYSEYTEEFWEETLIEYDIDEYDDRDVDDDDNDDWGDE